MEVSLVNVYKPKTSVAGAKLSYDYSIYTPKLRNCLIPLEIIYRNGLPEGSSVFKRLEQGKITLKDLGLRPLSESQENASQNPSSTSAQSLSKLTAT